MSASVWYHGRFVSGREPFCAALQPRFAMAAPVGRQPTLLSVINNAELEGTISAFMTDDKFILLIAQASREARDQARLPERRFLLRLDDGQ